MNRGIAETEDRRLIHTVITTDAKNNRTIRVVADQRAAIRRSKMKSNQRQAVNHKIGTTADSALRRSQLIEAAAERIVVNAITTQ